MAYQKYPLENNLKKIEHAAADTAALERTMPVNKADLVRMKNILRSYDPDVYKMYRSELNDMIESIPEPELTTHSHGSFTNTQSHEGFIMAEIRPKLRGYLVVAVEAVGTDKQDFELLRELIRWYGIERKQAKLFKEHIPGDFGRGRYDGEPYDGTTYDTFTLDNIGFHFYDPVAMASAIFNNKWSPDKLQTT